MKQEIICINDIRNISKEIVPNWVVKGKIYTIKKVQNSLEGGFGFILNEIDNPPLPAYLNGVKIGMFEPGFSSTRFVNLDNTEISISLEKEETIKNN